MSKLTIKQSVINVCNKLQPGQTILGYELYDLVLADLIRNGYPGRPLQETVAKRYREVRDSVGMFSVSGISEYTKKSVIELNETEKQQGQRVLF